MTQKELLYVEDAIGHEKTIISNVIDYIIYCCNIIFIYWIINDIYC